MVDAQRARRLLGERVAVALAVRSTDESRDDLEAPVGDVDGLAPEVGEPKVDVELEQVDSRRVGSHVSSVRVPSDGVAIPYGSSERTVNGIVQSSRDAPSMVSRHS